MLIVEGPDLVGKTTLCHRLLRDPRLQDAGYIYRHYSRLPSGYDYVMDYVRNATHKAVQDRFHMSEPVYSWVRGETESPLTPERYRLVDGYLRMMGAFTVVLVASDELLKSRWREGEMYPLELVLAANGRFKRLTEGTTEYSRPDYDARYDLSMERPHLTDAEVAHIADRYLKRQATLTATIIKSKPQTLLDLL